MFASSSSGNSAYEAATDTDTNTNGHEWPQQGTRRKSKKDGWRRRAPRHKCNRHRSCTDRAAPLTCTSRRASKGHNPARTRDGGGVALGGCAALGGVGPATGGVGTGAAGGGTGRVIGAGCSAAGDGACAQSAGCHDKTKCSSTQRETRERGMQRSV